MATGVGVVTLTVAEVFLTGTALAAGLIAGAGDVALDVVFLDALMCVIKGVWLTPYSHADLANERPMHQSRLIDFAQSSLKRIETHT